MKKLAIALLAAVGIVVLVIGANAVLEDWVEEEKDWYLEGAASDTLTLAVEIGSSTCSKFERVDVEETPTEVHLTNIVSTKVSGGLFPAYCTADLRWTRVDVELEEPLGVRTLTGCIETFNPGDCKADL